MDREKYFELSPRIARWKIDTPLENWLANKAETSIFWRKAYLLFYNIFDHQYYKRGREMAENAIVNHASGRNITNINEVVDDMIFCLHKYGYSFQDYCIYEFAVNQDIGYRTSFVADKLRYHYCDILNAPNTLEILTNKFSCFKHYKQFYKREMIGCFSNEDKDLLIDFTSRHGKFIFKPLEAHSGNGVEIYDVENLNLSRFFNEKLSDGAFVLEELIIQGEETARMHPKSINSCRVLTFTNKGKVNIIGTIWRVGSGGSIKDNAGAGGMYAYVNPETGVVDTDAINFKGIHYKSHPDTGLSFKGYQMPAWDDAITLISEMATNIAGTTLIAWDIAYSKDGWVMVEANENGGWRIIQSNKKIGYKNLLFSYMDQYFGKNE